jgi:hypothetical protein
MSGNTSRTFIVILSLVGIALASAPLLAAVKDSDADGITDQAEIDVYHTDPYNFDTDSDSFSDGEELGNGTDPLDDTSNPLNNTAQQTTEKLFILDRTSKEWLSAIALIFATSLLGLSAYFVIRKRRGTPSSETMVS